jgi:hypothetical protein
MSQKNYRVKVNANEAAILQALHVQVKPDAVAAAVLQSILYQVEQQKAERQFEGTTASQGCQLSFLNQLEEKEGS